jgi:hypothetical protein
MTIRSCARWVQHGMQLCKGWNIAGYNRPAWCRNVGGSPGAGIEMLVQLVVLVVMVVLRGAGAVGGVVDLVLVVVIRS